MMPWALVLSAVVFVATFFNEAEFLAPRLTTTSNEVEPEYAYGASGQQPLFSYSITTLPPDEAAEFGVLDWPRYLRTDHTFTETLTAEDGLVTRYVLEGTATITVETVQLRNTRQVYAGSLIDVIGPATIEWGGMSDQVVILSPNSEHGSRMARTAAAFLTVLCGALLASGLS